MKKTNFILLILGTISAVMFALGMCMALITEWNACRNGVVLGPAGLTMGLVTVSIQRKMEHKPPIRLNLKSALAVALCDPSAFRLSIAPSMDFAVCNQQKTFRTRNRCHFGPARGLDRAVPDVDIFIDAAGAESVLDGYMKLGKFESRFASVAVNSAIRTAAKTDEAFKVMIRFPSPVQTSKSYGQTKQPSNRLLFALSKREGIDKSKCCHSQRFWKWHQSL